MELDETDLRIMNELKNDGRATVREMASKLRLPITTVHNRLRKLQVSKTIKKFTIEPDYEKLDRGITALVMMKLSHENINKETGIETLKKKLTGFEEVEKVYALTGEFDWLMIVRVKNIKALDNFLVRKLRSLKEITTTITQIVLEEA